MSATIQQIYKLFILFWVVARKQIGPKAAERGKRLCFLNSWLNTNTTLCMLGLFFRNVKHHQPSLTLGGAEDAQTRPLKAWFGSWDRRRVCLRSHDILMGHLMSSGTFKIENSGNISHSQKPFSSSIHFNLACSFSEWITRTAFNSSLRSETVWRKYFLPIGECWLIYSESSQETLITEKVQLLVATWPLAFRDLYQGHCLCNGWMDGWSVHVYMWQRGEGLSLVRD